LVKSEGYYRNDSIRLVLKSPVIDVSSRFSANVLSFILLELGQREDK
jgi:hypothetical protein